MDNQFLIDLQKEDVQDHPMATLSPEMESLETAKNRPRPHKNRPPLLPTETGDKPHE